MVVKVYEKPEIWQIYVELPRSPLKNLNSYVICTPERNLVIDTGFKRPECQKCLWEGIEELRLDLSKTALFITHIHMDHMGQVESFVEKGCTVYMNEVDYAYFGGVLAAGLADIIDAVFVEEGYPQTDMDRMLPTEQQRKYRVEKLFPAIPVRGGARIPLGDLEAVCLEVPGHTPGNSMLYLPEEQILFSGDHILFDITPNIAPWVGMRDPLEDYMNSLRKTRELPVRLTLPAHRTTMKKDVYSRIDELLAHHEERLEEILEAVGRFPGSDAYGIAGKIKWSMRGKTWEQAAPNQRWFAIGETLAHIRHLMNHGKVVRRTEGNRIGYYLSEHTASHREA